MPKYGIHVDTEVMAGRRLVEASLHLEVDADDWDAAQGQASDLAEKMLGKLAAVAGEPALDIESVY